MEEKKYNNQEALKLLTSGYLLKSHIDHKDVHLSYKRKEDKIRIQYENSILLLSRYAFLDLYKETLFILDEENMDEESVDIKKDEEYYSWRQ